MVNAEAWAGDFFTAGNLMKIPSIEKATDMLVRFLKTIRPDEGFGLYSTTRSDLLRAFIETFNIDV